MKTLVYTLMAVAITLVILGITSRYITPLFAGVNPSSYLRLAQVLLLIGANLILLEIVKK